MITTTAANATRRSRANKRMSTRRPELSTDDLQLIAQLRESAKLSVRLKQRQAGMTEASIEPDTSASAFDAALAVASANAVQDQIDAAQDLARGAGGNE